MVHFVGNASDSVVCNCVGRIQFSEVMLHVCTTLLQARNWIKELRRMLGDDIVVCIVGNKIDLEKNRTVTQRDAEK